MESSRSFPPLVVSGLFIISGISALIYQMVWQRALLTLYGSNAESVAMVVAAFLVGLGFGSLLGGLLSRMNWVSPVVCFAICELGVGVYGLVSLDFFKWAASHTSLADSLATGLLAFGLVFLPTLLMGATLPLLVSYQTREFAHAGKAVSSLYFVNTLGAALGAFFAVFYCLGRFGMSGSVRIAALLNLLVTVIVLGVWIFRGRRAS
jgi:predicted membrane-bound spermidine synthase